MPPLVQVATTSAFAVSGTFSVTLPFVVLSAILSAPSDARSTLTAPLVEEALTAPLKAVAWMPPLVVRATTVPVSPVSVTPPLVVRALTAAALGGMFPRRARCGS